MESWRRELRSGNLLPVLEIQWGDIATWVAAVGTVSAVGIALWQVARERGARVARDTQDRMDRHLAQARLISAWLGPAEPVPDVDRIETDDVEDDRSFNFRTPIYVQNSSAEPIYEVVAGIVFIQGAAPRTLEGILDLRNRQRQETAEAAAKGEDVARVQRAYARNPVTTTGIVPRGLGGCGSREKGGPASWQAEAESMPPLWIELG
jgi:hypothetical protein